MPSKAKAKGPTQIVVSIGAQKLTVYSGNEVVGTSRISSGQPGFDTPQGIFSIIQKRKRHFSNIYRGAPMPFMQRLTWSGIALHQGVVPGYRASHGCIRLPGAFARSLFGFTQKRTHVVVTGDNPRPRPLSHPALFQPTPFEIEPEAVRANRGIAGPERTKTRYALNTASATTSDATALAGKPEASKRNPDVIAETGNSYLTWTMQLSVRIAN